MEHLPLYLPLLFGLTVALALMMFAVASNYSKPFLVFLLLLIVVQSALGLSGFYSHADAMTKRFPLLVLPLMVVCTALFISKKGRLFIDSLDIKMLTLLHTVRILVEIVLLGLYVHKGIPQAMTFEGRNFDILSGLSAPVVYYFVFIKKQWNRKVLLIWNVLCVLLLTNVVANAFLSLPDRYQSFSFEQPNVAVGYFPFLLLPSVLVPLVLFSNIAAIRKLILNKDFDIER